MGLMARQGGGREGHGSLDGRKRRKSIGRILTFSSWYGSSMSVPNVKGGEEMKRRKEARKEGRERERDRERQKSPGIYLVAVSSILKGSNED